MMLTIEGIKQMDGKEIKELRRRIITDIYEYESELRTCNDKARMVMIAKIVGKLRRQLEKLPKVQKKHLKPLDETIQVKE